QNFCLFPNPAQNWVNVEILSGNTQTPHTVELLTLYGGLVDRRDLAAGETITGLSLAHLSAGIYLVRVSAPGKKGEVLKLVKE
ncbi:MAG: T9SS type A sorting domain-containing protein, partial [Bacteroidia bacterium]|nr:T9SS type A sorting domain-containing protein [Bacteroidia bacterium]